MMNETQYNKPVLMVIDDSKTFLEMMVMKDLTDVFEVVTLHYQTGYSLENIINKIRKAQPDHLLLDVNLDKPGNSQTLLENATLDNAIPVDCSIWIITQDGGKEAQKTLSNYRQINIQTQNKLLTKPISARILRAEMLDESVYEETYPLDKDFPIPMRVISAKGKVAFCNNGWKGAEHIPPPDNFLTWLEEGEIPEEKQYVGSFPGITDKIYAGYRIISFPLEQDEENFLGQMAIMSALPDQAETLQDTLDLIFSTMEAAGFYRGRYYRFTPLAEHSKQSEYDTLMELFHVKPELPSQNRLPYRFPLTGELNRRFGNIPNAETIIKYGREKTLFWNIRDYTDDKKGLDDQISKLNQLLEINAETTPCWLEIPIYIRDFDRVANGGIPGCRIAGLLIFDQHKPNRSASQFIDLEKIRKERIFALEPLLYSLIYRLNQVLKNEQDEKLRNYEYSMRQLDRQLNREKDNDRRYQLVLEALTKHCRADSAILVIREGSSLQCTACLGDKLPPFIRGLRFPLQSKNYLLTNSFVQKNQVVIQDYSSESFKKNIQDGLEYQNELNLNEEQKEQFVKWLKSIDSAVAIPVNADHEHPMGSIALQYSDSWGANSRRMNSALAILHRVRWVMQDALRQEKQRSWEKIIGHDLGSNLQTIEQCCQLFADKNSDIVKSSDTFKELCFYLQDAIDQTNNLQKIWSEDMEKTYENLKPRNIIQSYLDLSKGYRKDNKIEINIIPDCEKKEWEVTLNLNNEIFARIVRNLLQNSFKHGRRFVDKKLGEHNTSLVTIEAEVKGYQWLLIITNPGNMSTEEYEARFEERPRSPKAKDGAHIGLSSVKFWADKMFCRISLENIDSNKVQAVLTCPITVEKNDG